jgi:signal transduction histidine kinase
MKPAATPARGLPIAAHLGLLAAISVAASFLVAVAIVILLPPRPPDIMRADQIIDGFAGAYAEAAAGQTPAPKGPLRFTFQTEPPRFGPRRGGPVANVIAARLNLPKSAVMAHAREVRGDNFVFRVQNLEGRREHITESHTEKTSVVTVDARTGAAVITETTREGAPPAPPVPPAAPMPTIIVAPPAPPPPPMFAPPPMGVSLLAGIEVAARLPDARWLVMTQVRSDDFDWLVRTFGAFAASLLLLGPLAWFFAQHLARPMEGFARAVQAVGVDHQHADIALTGPREMQHAATAVNAMQARLRALIADRTQTLATVAHDMRTPLMRMRLTAEGGPPELRDKLAKDIADVEALVASFIAFARDDPAEETRVRLDLAALIESLVEDHRASGKAATYCGPERLIMVGQPLGLKRVFANLLDNAAKHAGAVEVTLATGDGAILVDVRDDGPGVPAALRQEIFKPFVRGVSTTSGAGLGLAAARSITRAHGGDIALVDSARGAHFRVSLPV